MLWDEDCDSPSDIATLSLKAYTVRRARLLIIYHEWGRGMSSLSWGKKMHEEDILGPTFKIHRRQRTSVATSRRGLLFTFFIHLCDCRRAPIKYSRTMQPSISSISHLGRSSRAVETTAGQSVRGLGSHLPDSAIGTASCTVTEILEMIIFLYNAGGTK